MFFRYWKFVTEEMFWLLYSYNPANLMALATK